VTNGYLEQIDPVPPSETKRRVEARLARQQVLTRDNPLGLSAILDQSVLQRRFGNPDVMREQLNQLIEMSERDNISLRILPLNGRHPIGTGAFALLQFGEVHDITHQDIEGYRKLNSKNRAQSPHGRNRGTCVAAAGSR
jgi:hypothetical protein